MISAQFRRLTFADASRPISNQPQQSKPDFACQHPPASKTAQASMPAGIPRARGREGVRAIDLVALSGPPTSHGPYRSHKTHKTHVLLAETAAVKPTERLKQPQANCPNRFPRRLTPHRPRRLPFQVRYRCRFPYHAPLRHPPLLP